MTDKPNATKTDQPMVAPGYPAIETVRQIDVTGWEPATVFTPAEANDAQEQANE